jgi:hypothetical protein
MVKVDEELAYVLDLLGIPLRVDTHYAHQLQKVQ